MDACFPLQFEPFIWSMTRQRRTQMCRSGMWPSWSWVATGAIWTGLSSCAFGKLSTGIYSSAPTCIIICLSTCLVNVICYLIFIYNYLIYEFILTPTHFTSHLFLVHQIHGETQISPQVLNPDHSVRLQKSHKWILQLSGSTQSTSFRGSHSHSSCHPIFHSNPHETGEKEKGPVDFSPTLLEDP